jgi:hypothetical protein
MQQQRLAVTVAVVFLPRLLGRVLRVVVVAVAVNEAMERLARQRLAVALEGLTQTVLMVSLILGAVVVGRLTTPVLLELVALEVRV